MRLAPAPARLQVRLVTMGSSPRPLADHCRQIAVRQAPRQSESVCLRWGSGTGEPEASTMLERQEENVILCYRWRDGEEWRTTRQAIGFRFDEPFLGGVRTFWRCPDCGLGARKLY